MTVEQDMREAVIVALEPERLDIINESHMHEGHASSPGTGESHFRMLVVSKAFSGRSRIERHRMVNSVLAGFLANRVHALAIKAYAPGEPIR